eukprot:scaffold8459_cov121-Isochrysis_galbana.AAC.7
MSFILKLNARNKRSNGRRTHGRRRHTTHSTRRGRDKMQREQGAQPQQKSRVAQRPTQQQQEHEAARQKDRENIEKMIQDAAQSAVAGEQHSAKLNAELAQQRIIDACAAAAPKEKPTAIAEAILRDLGAAGGTPQGGTHAGEVLGRLRESVRRPAVEYMMRFARTQDAGRRGGAGTAPGKGAESGADTQRQRKKQARTIYLEQAKKQFLAFLAMGQHGDRDRRSETGAVSESALSGGTALVWPWRGARCLASVGSGASGSRASVSSVGGSVVIALHVISRCLRPHTIIPLPWRERGIQFPQHKNEHTSQARGDEERKAQGGGKRNIHLAFRGRSAQPKNGAARNNRAKKNL